MSALHGAVAMRPKLLARVLDHALHTLGLRRVVADIDPINTASISVARKLRLVADGTVPCGERTVIRYIAGITRMRA